MNEGRKEGRKECMDGWMDGMIKLTQPRQETALAGIPSDVM